MKFLILNQVHKKSWDLETINKHFNIDKESYKNNKIKLLGSGNNDYWAFISNLDEF